MKSCVLHIGSEKTGTTSIQKFFVVNREAILEDGFWYPRAGRYRSTARHRQFSDAALGLLLDKDPSIAQFVEELHEAEKQGAHTAIISSEFFHSKFREAAPIAHLREFLSRYFDTVKVVYYARRQDHLAVSMHSTAIRLGKLSDRSALSIYELQGHHYFDHLAIADLWAEQFGRDNLICRVYDRTRLKDGDVVSDLRAIIGIERAADSNPFGANESLSTECMDTLSLLNASPQTSNEKLRQAILAVGRQRGGEKAITLTRDQARAFMDKFQHGNRAFFTRYIDPALGRDFADGFDMFPETLPPLTADEIVDFLFGTPAQPGTEQNAVEQEKTAEERRTLKLGRKRLLKQNRKKRKQAVTRAAE